MSKLREAAERLREAMPSFCSEATDAFFAKIDAAISEVEKQQTNHERLQICYADVARSRDMLMEQVEKQRARADAAEQRERDLRSEVERLTAKNRRLQFAYEQADPIALAPYTTEAKG